jgi:hypothetical protein
MSHGMKEELIQLLHACYPPRAEGPADRLRTPQGQRWEAAWDKAVDWPECDALIHAVQDAFTEHRAGRFIQPRMVACLYCVLVLEPSGPESAGIRTRIVGAISVLAPLYLVYVTREPMGSAWCPDRARLSFVPQGAEKPYADTLARLIEQHLGYRPFPLELADVPVPDIRVDFLHMEQPTLLTALFANRLEDLP